MPLTKHTDSTWPNDRGVAAPLFLQTALLRATLLYDVFKCRVKKMYFFNLNCVSVRTFLVPNKLKYTDSNCHNLEQFYNYRSLLVSRRRPR